MCWTLCHHVLCPYATRFHSLKPTVIQVKTALLRKPITYGSSQPHNSRCKLHGCASNLEYSPFTNSPMWPIVSALCVLSFTRHPKRFHPSKHRMRYRCWQSFHQTIKKNPLDEMRLAIPSQQERFTTAVFLLHMSIYILRIICKDIQGGARAYSQKTMFIRMLKPDLVDIVITSFGMITRSCWIWSIYWGWTAICYSLHSSTFFFLFHAHSHSISQ